MRNALIHFLHSSLFMLCISIDLIAQDNEYITITIWKNGIHKNFYGATVDSITISPTPKKSKDDPYNGHEYVDMGLPSGTLWATCNVGATDALSPGLYVSWAELGEKDYYSWEDTKYFDGSWLKQTKYCTNSNHGKVDNILELEFEDDIAYVNWGKNWRIPTVEDFKELLAFCSWTFDSSLPGFVVTSNDKCLYFPITGYKTRNYTEASSMNDSENAPKSVFWTRDLVSYSSDKAFAYVFSGYERQSNTAPSVSSSKLYRYHGCAVRPVTYLPNKEDSEIGYLKIWSKGNHVKLSIEQIDSIVFHFTDGKDVFTHNGYEYVDLGLPSGVMWASCNIGADSIKGHGCYFSWGEVTSKEEYSWKTYKLGNGKGPLEGLQLSKYCLEEQYGIVDNIIELSTQDDAANMIWGDGWRTPSYYDIYELIRYCKRSEVRNSSRVNTLKGLPDGSGITYTGPNGNSIFLPAAGYKMEKRIVWLNELLAYWLNQLMNSTYAAHYYDSFSTININGKDRCYGMPLRPVLDYMKAGNLAYEKEPSSKNCMNVSYNGESCQFLIGLNPTITYGSGKIKLKASTIVKNFELSKNITIVFDDSKTTLINHISKDEYTIIDRGNEIIIQEIKESAMISLYKKSGEKVFSIIPHNEIVSIDASSLTTGEIYLLKIGRQVYKFIKK